MRSLSRLVVSLLVLLPISLGSGAGAAERVLTLDPAETHVSFHLGATGHDVEGLFGVSEGSVGFDPATGKAWGEIRIDTRQASTGNKKRDKTMHRKVLESEEHPLAVFRPERIEGQVAADGESTFDLVGTFTLLGVEHPLTLPTTARIHDGVVEATSTFPIPYIDWGLHNPSMLVLRVAKVVDIEVEAVGRLSGHGAAATGE